MLIDHGWCILVAYANSIRTITKMAPCPHYNLLLEVCCGTRHLLLPFARFGPERTTLLILFYKRNRIREEKKVIIVI